MKHVLLLLFFAFFCVSASADDAGEVLFDFTGAPQPGMKFSYQVRSTLTRNCEMKMPGLPKKPVRRDTREVFANGVLFYVSRTEDTKVFELTLDAMHGSINGRRLDFPEYTGSTVVITLAKENVSFRINPQNLSFDAEQKTLTPEAEYFLRALFSAVTTDSPSIFLGDRRPMRIGKHYTINVSPIVSSLRERGIMAEESHIESFAEYPGDTSFIGTPVRRVNILAQGKGIPGYDFKMEASLLYPVKTGKPDSGPIRVARHAMEVVTTFFPGGNPFFPGAAMEVVETDMTDINLLPLKK